MSWHDALLKQMGERLLAGDVTPLAYPLAFAGGLLTNLCLCTITLVPIAIGYIGGFSRYRERRRAFAYAAVFAAGIVITISALGVLACLIGAALAPIRDVFLCAVAVLVVLMGIHCIGIVKFRIPGLSRDWRPKKKGLLGSFLFGLAAGVIATPCTTPVLAVILAYVAVQARLLYGLTLLLTYAIGFVIPLVLVGLFADLLARLEKLDKRTHYEAWIGRVSGVVMIAFGVYLFVQTLGL